jgi:hypothetical protein
LGVAETERGREGAFENTALSAEDAGIGAATVEAEDTGQGSIRVMRGGTHLDGVTRKLMREARNQEISDGSVEGGSKDRI